MRMKKEDLCIAESRQASTFGRRVRVSKRV